MSLSMLVKKGLKAIFKVKNKINLRRRK